LARSIGVFGFQASVGTVENFSGFSGIPTGFNYSAQGCAADGILVAGIIF
jgi:hypothetical protein